MKRLLSFLFLVSPIILGLGFIATVAFGHWLFSNSIFGVRAVMVMEAAYLLAFSFSLIAAIAAVARSLRERNLLHGLLIAASVILGLYLLGVGFENGAALLYAT